MQGDQVNLLKMLAIWRADLSVARSALTFLSDIEDGRTYSIHDLRRFKCYETTFVISYGRPFTASHGGNPDRLTFEIIDIKLTDDEKTLHNEIRNVRNKMYAHTQFDWAHFRLDFQEETANGNVITLPYHKFDEGLEFSDLQRRMDAAELTAKISFAISRKIFEIAGKLEDKSSIYVKPSRFMDGA